jgi:hypothetical protein
METLVSPDLFSPGSILGVGALIPALININTKQRCNIDWVDYNQHVSSVRIASNETGVISALPDCSAISWIYYLYKSTLP